MADLYNNAQNNDSLPKKRIRKKAKFKKIKGDKATGLDRFFLLVITMLVTLIVVASFT